MLSIVATTLLAVSNNGGSHPPPMVPSKRSMSQSEPSHLFIGGLGFCGIRIAEVFREAFPECQISGCVRSEERKESILSQMSARNVNMNVHVLDLDDDYSGLDTKGLSDLTSASHIIQTVAPIADFDRDPLLALHAENLTAAASSSSPFSSPPEGTLKWIGYISSTGVYGDYDGEWVSEESELRCIDTKSLARVQAEKEWMAFEGAKNGQPRVDCFRCGGIYGPNRSPLFTIIKESVSAAAVTTPESNNNGITPKYINRILVDDICGALLAAVTSNRPRHAGRIYNLVDDEPAPRSDVIREARRLLKLNEVLSADDANVLEDVGAPAAAAKRPIRVARKTGNKQCRNQRLKEEYGWKLKAATFREGLAHLIETELS